MKEKKVFKILSIDGGGIKGLYSASILEKFEKTLEKEIKKKTLELFRRDSRNVEIITYDELYERAQFIAIGEKAIKQTNTVIDDDLPF